MAEVELECVGCRSRFDDSPELWACPKCGSGLQIVVDTGHLRYEKLAAAWRARPFGVWRYRELLPPGPEEVTLHEGGTGLLPTRLLADSPFPITAFVKNEGQNPTGSFKDRGMTVGATHARGLGRRRLICASTGNTAASLSAYAARGGMEGVVLVPAGGIARGKLAQAVLQGAKVLGIQGSFDDAMRVVGDAAKELGAYMLNSINPYRIEGQKTAAFEVFEQLGGRAPDALICPVGNGGNLAAYWKGFRELRALGGIDRLPRLIGVQAEGAAPIANALMDQREEIVPVEHPVTVASAIRIGNPANWTKTLRAIRESGGTALKLSDAAILEAQRQLASREGIFVEPASAASVAGALRMARDGGFSSGETVVCVATGHGLKDPELVLQGRVDPPEIPPNVEAIARALREPDD